MLLILDSLCFGRNMSIALPQQQKASENLDQKRWLHFFSILISHWMASQIISDFSVFLQTLPYNRHVSVDVRESFVFCRGVLGAEPPIIL